MTDDSPPQESPTDPESSSLHLQYPNVLLQASFSSLLSNSFPVPTMADSPAPPHPSPKPEASLGESWASLVNSDFGPEDDLRSESTDIGSLLDTNGPEDIHSLNGQDTLSNDSRSDATSDYPLPYSHQVEAVTAKEFVSDPQDSAATLRGTSLDTIEFQEPDEWPDVGEVTLKHTTHVLSGTEAAVVEKVLRSYSSVQPQSAPLFSAIKMTMSRSKIALDRPFQVMFAGTDRTSKARADILRKIGDILVAGADCMSSHGSMEASRYHVIPSEFGPGSAPTFAELVPIQTQMIVDDCVDAWKASDSARISLMYHKGQIVTSSKDGAEFSVQPQDQWNQPDIAVIFIGKDGRNRASTQERTVRLVNAFMNRHNVPRLIINETHEWETDPIIDIAPKSLHRCIETRLNDETEDRVLWKAPVDLDTFDSLSSEQLNRHFAAMAAVCKARPTPMTKHVSFANEPTYGHKLPESVGDVEKNLRSCLVARSYSPSKIRPQLADIITLLFVLVTASFGYATVKFVLALLTVYFSGPNAFSSIAPSTVGNTLQPNLSTSASASATVPAATTPLSFLSLSAPTLVAGAAKEVSPAIARLLSQPLGENTNKSDKFEVSVIGDYHILLKVPQKAMINGKTPHLYLRVQRDGQRLETSMLHLTEEVQAIELDREEAYGIIQVIISTDKRKIAIELHEVDFGSPWLKVVGWKKAGRAIADRVRDDFDTAQTSLLSARDRFMEDVAPELQSRFEKLRLRTQEVSTDLGESAGKTAVKTAEVVRNKLDQLRRILAEQKQHGYENIKKEIDSAHHKVEEIVRSASAFEQQFAERTFESIVSGAGYLKERMAEVDLTALRSRLQDLTRTEVLAKAQERAKQIVRDSKRQLQRRNQDDSKEKPMFGRSAQMDKRKGMGKKAKGKGKGKNR